MKTYGGIMATANTTFSVVEQYFDEEVFPKLSAASTETLEILKEKFIREVTFDAVMVQKIENFYGVRIW